MKIFAHTCVPVLALLLFSAPATQAQDRQQDQRQDNKQDDNMVVLTNPDAKAVAAYWTPERFKAARPLPLPQASSSAVQPQEAPRLEGQVESSDARAPSVRAAPPEKRLFTPGVVTPGAAAPDARQQNNNGDVTSPGAVGTFGAHFTSSRVFPQFTGSAAPFSADRAYPYITTGTLFFSIGGVPYLCSASVIQHRIVATAGHCVHSGTASGFHSNWVFVPAYRDGTAPLLVWNWRAAIVTGTWATGGGTVPNAADYAMIEFGDQAVGGASRALGDVTGWLGWQTRSLSANHTSKLGYPCNLDRCRKMQIITSAAFRNVAPNNVEYGSDALGGSSGGPWIQNFQVLQAGGGTGTNTGSNRVVGVTSYIYVPSDPKVQGASIPDRRWVGIFNALCARVPGNCL
jgi:V8-like Glu-specific endopeptidase